MKKILLVTGLLLWMLSLSAQDMRAFISHKAYCTPKMQPYIEFTFIIGGTSVQYEKNSAGKYEAAVEIRVDVTQKDSVVKSLHYILSSDAFADTSSQIMPDFADIKNLPVPNGAFFLNFYIKDLHSDSVELKYIDQITLDFPDHKISSSKISLYKEMSAPISPGMYVKYGHYMPPLYYNFVPESQYVLPFAVEIYNTKRCVGANKSMTVRYYIENAENRMAAQPNNIITKTVTTEDVLLVVGQLNVFSLPSGNYNMVVELFDEQDSLLQMNKLFFQKSNPSVKFDIERYNDVVTENSFVAKITDRTELESFVQSLYPISTNVEREFFDTRMKSVTTEQLQRFFYSFWLTRNPKDPETEWINYNKRVQYVQEKFGSKQVKGYKTDRGRVYLQYGKPNDMIEVPSDPVSMPYEIWHYYYLDQQSNVKFVFYDPSLVGNDYELLHSNKYGELHDSNWKLKLVKKMQPQTDIYDPKIDDYFGGDINDNWKYH